MQTNLPTNNNFNNGTNNITVLPFEKTIYSWTSPNKLLYDFGMKEFRALSFIFLILSIFFGLILGKWLVVLVFFSLLFLIYSIITRPVEYTTTLIKTSGILTDEKLYPWENIKGFWFCKKSEDILLYIDTSLKYPSRLIFVIPKQTMLIDLYYALIPIIPYKLLTSNQSWYQWLIDGEYINIFDYLKENYPKEFEKELEKELQSLQRN